MNSERIKIIDFLKTLQTKIIAAFESIEREGRFQRKPWQHHSGGGGEMAVLRGKTFEKAAVNWSAVSGDEFPMQDGKGPFFATGVSLITHMANPHAPTAHMNVRYIETKETSWFGGGYDLTPMGFPYEEDRVHFHTIAKNALDPLDRSLYPLFSAQAKEYFYIPHREKERGIGGIFFDHYNSQDAARDFAMWKSVAESFIEAIMPIYKRRIDQSYSHDERRKQLELRGHYVEFNLLYDKGTKFGFYSKGNPEAILCSLPPLVSW
jgi:coproporphyrinogen III oxidase